MEAKKPLSRLILIAGLCLMITIIIYLFSLGEQIVPQFSQESITRITTFSEASIAKEVLNTEMVEDFPGSLVFAVTWPEDKKALTAIPDLKGLSQGKDSIWSLMNHCNLTLVNVNGTVYSVMPKRMRGENLDLEDALKQNKFEIFAKGDLIMFATDDFEQTPISHPLLEKVNPNLDDSPCTVKLLNCFQGDKKVYRYTIRGTVHYLNPHDQELIQRSARYPYGGAEETARSKSGMYVVRIPNIMSEEIIGMYGGSAVITFENQEYFLGLNSMIIMLAAIDGDETTYITLMAIEPVLKSDFNF
ncbi:MAG: hypothetical protein HY931_00825 [Candidatus Falkowbacteria bacterium]|nr:MAG: hypothetical protein HY931_00825 [Candidatus Falkowbacteria bacterium]